MNRLLEFIQQVNKDMGINMPSDWQKLSNLELAQKFVKGLNRYVFQTYKGIGKVHFQGEEFEYISEFHKFWESNHRLILNASINIEQAHKAAASISHAIQDYGPSILRVMHDTCGLRPQA